MKRPQIGCERGACGVRDVVSWLHWLCHISIRDHPLWARERLTHIEYSMRCKWWPKRAPLRTNIIHRAVSWAFFWIPALNTVFLSNTYKGTSTDCFRLMALRTTALTIRTRVVVQYPGTWYWNVCIIALEFPIKYHTLGGGSPEPVFWGGQNHESRPR